MALRSCSLLLLSTLALISANIPSAAARAFPRIESPCSACQAISKELRIRIQNERPRNHLDMRHRLDSNGQRYGKVIDYKISELRVLELLDGLCGPASLGQYIPTTITITASGNTTFQWSKLTGDEADSMVNRTRHEPAQIEQAMQRMLQNYCAAVMEEFEEALEQEIIGGKFSNVGAIEEFLCTKSVKACPDGTLPTVFIDEPAPPQDEGSVQAEAGSDQAEVSEASSAEEAAEAPAAAEGIASPADAVAEAQRDEL